MSCSSQRCDICGANKDPYKGSKLLFQCRKCKHIFKVVSNNDEVQATYHLKTGSKKLTLGPNGDVPDSFHRNRKQIVQARVKTIKFHLSPSTTILDVGGSCGTFAKEVKPHVSEVEVTDLTAYHEKECTRLGFKFYRGPFLSVDIRKRYSLVSAWHVVEHVEDVADFLLRMYNLSSSKALIEVPLKRRPIETMRDGHVHYFTEASALQLFKSFFRLCEVKTGIQQPALLLIGEKALYKEN